MSHNLMVAEAVSSFRATINQAINLAETCTLTELLTINFNTRDLSEKWRKQLLKEVRTGSKNSDVGKCSLYVFTLMHDYPSEDIWEAVHSAKQEIKDSEKKSNLCAINPSHTSSRTLYVGRSFTPRTRLKQHLDHKINGTYALHLEQWALPLKLDIELKLYDIPEYKETLPFERAMNVLETGMWDYLRPLLGRRGDK